MGWVAVSSPVLGLLAIVTGLAVLLEGAWGWRIGSPRNPAL